jgi:RHS repeat-associated protein
MNRFNDFSYYLLDHLGSTRAIVDEDGDVKVCYDYYPFGLNMRQTIVSGDEAMYKFTGKERDDGSNYDYFGVRYYDSSIGRWMAPDPSNQYHSPFVYCGNNPYKYVDKDGGFAFSILIPGAIGGTFGAVNAGVAAWRAADGNLSGKWGDFTLAVITGGVSGAVAAYGGIFAGGAANVAQVAAAEYFMTGKINTNDISINFMTGVFGAWGAKYLPFIPGKTYPIQNSLIETVRFHEPAFQIGNIGMYTLHGAIANKWAIKSGENMIGVFIGEYLGGKSKSATTSSQRNTVFYNELNFCRMSIPSFEADIWTIDGSDSSPTNYVVEVEIYFNNSEPF